MEGGTEDSSKLSSRENSSRGSIKSTKSLEKNTSTPHSNTGSLKSDKDVHFAKSSVKIKDCDNQKHLDASLKVPHKFITNWRQACDRTRDRTRDLLKRWRTLPEFEGSENDKKVLEKKDSQTEKCGWSVHVWTTWVDRFSVETSEWDSEKGYQLTQTQNYKFSHFFSRLLDHDQDDLISEPDFEALIERFRHFADWSTNSAEFNILREVERGFMDTFLNDVVDERLGFQVNNQVYVTKEGWLFKWSQLVNGAKNLSDFPIWLQYFGKVLFQVVNRSGSGVITRDELSSFYSSVLGLDATSVGQILDLAYQAMTSNGDHPLVFHAYRLCFANYLLGRYPNGPGQYILGAAPNSTSLTLFPVDYSALNTPPEDLEQYAPDQKSNRRSVIV